MIQKDTTITLGATALKTPREYGRDAAWTVVSPVYGHGTTLAEARVDASIQLDELVRNTAELPAVVRDVDGRLRIFTARADGYRETRIHPDDKASGVTWCGSGSPSSAADAVVRERPGSVRLV